jgi:hypothetical protein
MIKEINFDMDGTIADLYGVEDWLEYLMNKDATPYIIAKPLVNLSALARIINRLQRNGYKICVISWLSKNSDNDYDKKVTAAKLLWLKNQLPSVKWDRISIVAYGTPKQTIGEGILFDDEEKNRDMWQGIAYDVNNIIEILKGLN